MVRLVKRMSNEELDDDWVSKSQIKREAESFVDLAKKIAALSKDQFEAMPMPEQLRRAIVEVRKLSKGGAIKRQFKYIGKILRDLDTELVKQGLERQLDKDRAASARLHILEQWRDKLVAGGDVALGEFLNEFPQADRQQLRQLQRKAKQEFEQEKPPVAARKIFQYLRVVVSE